MINLQNKLEDQRAARKRAQDRREMMDECHVIPDITYNAKQEKMMKKAATFGVVALFKAVAKHQRDLKRSFDEIDSDDDVLQKKTMRIEQNSTNRLISTLNESSSNQQMIETPNPFKKRINNKIKKRKLNDGQSKLPKHLQSILLDKNTKKDDIDFLEDSDDGDIDESDMDSDIDSDTDHDDDNKKSKQWRVLDDDDVMIDGYKSNKSRQDIMDGDSEFEDDSD